MSESILDFKLIKRWCLVFAAFWAAGFLFKAYYTFFIFGIFFWLYIEKKFHYQLYLLIIWIFIERFFQGIRYLDPTDTINIYGTSGMLLFLLFINMNNFSKIYFTKGYSIFLVSLGIIILSLIISFLIYGYNPLRIIGLLVCQLLFVLIIIYPKRDNFVKDLINLIISIALFQIPVALMQYLNIIQRSYLLEGNTIREAFADDAASGTFGSGASPDLSLFLTFFSFIFLLIFIRVEKIIFLLLGLFLLSQYFMADSKTPLFISGLVLVFIFFKEGNVFYDFIKMLNFKRVLIISSFLILGWISINYFYNKMYEYRNMNQTKEMVSSSVKNVFLNVKSWGKIQGFAQVTKLHRSKEGALSILFGLGPHEYTEELMYRVNRTLDRRLTRGGFANNFINNDSSLIWYYAEIGIIGLLGLILLHISMIRMFFSMDNKSEFFLTVSKIIGPFLLGLIIFAFIHPALAIDDLTLLTIWVLAALKLKLNLDEKMQSIELLKM